MTAEIIDFYAARAKRDEKFAQAVEAYESIACAVRPYASMDDLPDVTYEGQLAIMIYVLYGWTEPPI